MALTVDFGNGATAQQFKLQGGAPGYIGDDLALGGGQVVEGPAGSGSAGGVVSSDPVVVDQISVPKGSSGSGGAVTVSFDSDANAFSFESSGWNAVKNAKATSNTAENVSFSDFVHVDVDFSAATRGESSVTIENVKRANIATGNGSDVIDITLATNNGDYQNVVNISTGGGSDSITLGAGVRSGGAFTTDGRFTTVTIDAGAGNDSVDLTGLNVKLASINGGTGNDSLTGSNGVDHFVYNSIAGFSNGSDIIENFQISQDKIDLNGLTVLAHANDLNGDLNVKLSDNTLIKLVGVSDSQYSTGLFI